MAKTAKLVFEATAVAFENMEQVVNSTAKRDEILAALNTANQVFTNSLLQTQSERKYSGIKKPLTAITNTVAGLVRGIEDRNTNLSETKRSLAMARKNFLSIVLNQIEAVDQAEIQKQDAAKRALAQQEADEAEILSQAAILNAAKKAIANNGKKLSDEDLQNLKKGFEAEANEMMPPKLRHSTDINTHLGPVRKNPHSTMDDEDLPAGKRVAERDEKWDKTKTNFVGDDLRDEHLKKKFAEWDALKSKIPSNMGKRAFSYVNLPLRPSFESFAMQTSENLTHFGIKHTPFGNQEDLEGNGVKFAHVILEDQLILYFSKDYAKKEMDMTPYEYALQIVAEANERQHDKYTVATEDYRTSPKNSDICMFWLLRTKVLNAMMAKQHSGKGKATPSARLKGWGFIFDFKEIMDGIRPPKPKV